MQFLAVLPNFDNLDEEKVMIFGCARKAGVYEYFFLNVQ